MIKILTDIKDIITRGDVQGESLSYYLVRGTAGSFLIQALTVVLTILSNFLVAKLCGAAEYGTFTYLFTCVTVGANIAVLGLNTLLIRQTSVYKSNEQWSKLKGLLLLSTAAVLAASCCGVLLFILLFPQLGFHSRIGSTRLFNIAIMVLPVATLLILWQSVLQGFRKILSGQLGEKVVRPFVFTVLFLIVYLFHDGQVTISALIWINIIAFGTALVWTFGSLVRHVMPQLRLVQATYEKRQWLRSTSYFFVIGAIQIINARADVLILGGFTGNTDVGVYNIAVRLSDFMTLSLLVINTVMAPAISQLYFSGQMIKLQRTVTAGARAALALSLPMLLILVFAGRPLLGFLGDTFSGGYLPLIIIAVAQFFNVLTGSVGNILIMTGNERLTFISLLAGSIVSLTLNFILTPQWGMTGTAVSVAAGIVIWNGLMYYFVRRKTKIFPTAFGRL